jgi:LacI family transcriptional regulator
MTRNDRSSTPAGPPTIRDVAERARVSVSTVSRVINGNSRVLPPVRDAVLEAITELQFQPNLAAQQLRRAHTRTLGLLVEDLRNPYMVMGHWEAVRKAADLGFDVVTADAQGSEENAVRLLSSFASKSVDGVLSTSPFQSVQAAINARPATIPAVFIGTELVPGLNVVAVRGGPAIQEAIAHLAELGHRHVGLAGYGPWLGRRDGLIGPALHSSGMRSSRPAQVPLREETLRAAIDLIGGADRPTALLIQPHDAIPFVLQALREVGLSVPRDISVIAFGDSDWSMAMNPPLSVLTRPSGDLAAIAVEWLVALCQGRTDYPAPAPREVVYIRRASVGPAPRG